MVMKKELIWEVLYLEYRKKNEYLERSITDCNIRQMEGEGNERKFELTFSSEKPYPRYFGDEILSHTDGAVDLTRLNSIGVVLFNHNRDAILGKIIKAWIEDNKGHAQIEFDKDEQSEVIYQKVLNQTLKGVSVGYNISVWESVEDKAVSLDGRFKGPCRIAKKWTPFEISIVSIPADETVGVGRSYEEEGVSSFYLNERQLQINKNLILTGGKMI